MLTLDQKLKFQKASQNPFYKPFTVVLCKKPVEKTVNILEMRPNLFYKLFTVLLTPLEKTLLKYSRNKTISKTCHYAKAIGFGKSLLWVKSYN